MSKKTTTISGAIVRQDGLYYCMTDLFRGMNANGLREDPWTWAKAEGVNEHVSRRGFLFQTCWAKSSVFVRYAYHLSPVLYKPAMRAVGGYRVEDRIDILGRVLGSRMDSSIALYFKRHDETSV